MSAILYISNEEDELCGIFYMRVSQLTLMQSLSSAVLRFTLLPCTTVFVLIDVTICRITVTPSERTIALWLLFGDIRLISAPCSKEGISMLLQFFSPDNPVEEMARLLSL